MSEIQGSALFSEPERLSGCAVMHKGPLFRWRLDRWWDQGPKALICMLNPSYADGETNDPTIHKLIKMVQAVGFPGFTAVNWSPYIATDPKDLQAWRWNEQALDMQANEQNLKLIEGLASDAAIRVVAWGNNVPRVPHTQRVIQAMSCGLQYDLMCFGRTKTGAPIHPMARGRNYIDPGKPLETFQESHVIKEFAS